MSYPIPGIWGIVLNPLIYSVFGDNNSPGDDESAEDFLLMNTQDFLLMNGSNFLLMG